MKSLLLLVLITWATNCNCQNLNLVPLDSSNFMIIADTLFDTHKIINDSALFKFDNVLMQNCPCEVENVKGIVSYKSYSVFIRSNKCMYIYQTDSDYYTRVGKMTLDKDKDGKYMWQFVTSKLKENAATKLINNIKTEIMKAKVPEFESLVIINDGVCYTFGDLENNLYATTPIIGYSNSVIHLIKLSDRVISEILK